MRATTIPTLPRRFPTRTPLNLMRETPASRTIHQSDHRYLMPLQPCRRPSPPARHLERLRPRSRCSHHLISVGPWTYPGRPPRLHRQRRTTTTMILTTIPSRNSRILSVPQRLRRKGTSNRTRHPYHHHQFQEPPLPPLPRAEHASLLMCRELPCLSGAPWMLTGHPCP